MGQFCQRIVLVHKLGQLGTSEEFLDGCRHRTNVHQSLRSRNINVLNGHSFLYDSFHSGQTDTELVLEKLSYRSQSSVSQMVYIVN